MSGSVPCLFAAIADDYTGGSDLAGMLFEGGVCTVQIFGLQPHEMVGTLAGRYQAAVLSLKSRSMPPAEACRVSLEALELLEHLNPGQVQFKYCSTFDSTPAGNIGPVAEALMDRLEVDFTVAMPALPVNGRTQYCGHLFINGQLLSESHMRRHPVNPMTDSNLVRWLQAQTRRKVGLIALEKVQGGADAIRREMDALRRAGVGIALIDAVCDANLENIAEAVADLRLITGGSGLGMKLPRLWRLTGHPEGLAPEPARAEVRGGTLVLSGSCSSATLHQLEILRATGCSMIRLDGSRLLSGFGGEIERLLRLALEPVRSLGRTVIYSSTPAEERDKSYRQSVAEGLPVEKLPSRIEAAFGILAERLICDGGVRNLVVAGGETAGVVVEALRIPAMEVTAILDPGVPALRSLGDSALGLILKSGNFGSADFFDKAIRYLEES